MSQIEIDRKPKGPKIPGKVAFVATLLLPILGAACLVMPEPVAVAFVATLLLPILGAACLVMPEPVAEHLPHLLGGVRAYLN